ncbi:exodeoxyribonuclease VII large subunit [Peptostreptococcus equinus]|uniref:Exodeoxyribonuclease 7 large subunit n=1 Tax=Peptostreptococcus equinus TaxID=3003601 RepID=A0ABY7JUN8_9FIRM|nr:exodeoxyribonuclease VII large subunit [Peptostreptococcus sp. CBA3647]WAW15617.1 exodeoxyribonuclease VII large subunit [Peptostreptococcus sp. CBA3647]
MKIRPLEVWELNNYMKKLLNDDPILSNVKVSGEISNLKVHSSGNVYLSLKDEKTKVNCVILKRYYDKDIKLENGQKIIASGSINVYERDGAYQLYINKIEVEGMGNLYIEFLKLKAKLEKEGLFSHSHKKQIPKFPQNIGVITSPTGAVIRDIINVITRRYPKVNIKLYPVLVQGQNSAKSLIEALEFMDKREEIDTIIIGRGGGSLEELWSFNDEELARKIFECNKPVISAVGHETDFTICDFVSDMRAPTPSAAAEIATPDIKTLINKQNILMQRISNNVSQKAKYERQLLKSSINSISSKIEKNIIFERQLLKTNIKNISNHIERYEIYERNIDLDKIKEKLTNNIDMFIKLNKEKINLIAMGLGNLNPFSVMDRGYSVAEKNGRTIQTISDVEKNDLIDIVLKDGNLNCKVIDKIKRS